MEEGTAVFVPHGSSSAERFLGEGGEEGGVPRLHRSEEVLLLRGIDLHRLHRRRSEKPWLQGFDGSGRGGAARALRRESSRTFCGFPTQSLQSLDGKLHAAPVAVHAADHNRSFI